MANKYRSTLFGGLCFVWILLLHCRPNNAFVFLLWCGEEHAAARSHLGDRSKLSCKRVHYIRRKSLKSRSLCCIQGFIPSRLPAHISAEDPSIVSDQGVSTSLKRTKGRFNAHHDSKSPKDWTLRHQNRHRTQMPRQI